MSDDRKQFESGAVRSSDADAVRYDLITPVGLRRLAETYAEGALKYSAWNWQKGIPASDLMNHALRHLMLWLSGDTSEDHLAHAAWNLFTVMHFEEQDPKQIDVPSRAGLAVRVPLGLGSRVAWDGHFAAGEWAPTSEGRLVAVISGMPDLYLALHRVPPVGGKEFAIVDMRHCHAIREAGAA